MQYHLILFLLFTSIHSDIIDSTIDSMFNRQDLTTLSICSYNATHPVAYERHYGYQDSPDDTIETNADSVYTLASISKTFVWISIAILKDTNVISSFDEDVNVVLRARGISVRHPQHPDVAITWRMFAEHTTGMAMDIENPTEESYVFGRNFPYSIEEVVMSLLMDAPVAGGDITFRTLWITGICDEPEFVTKESCEFEDGIWTEGNVPPPGERFSYSNIATHFAAWLVSVASGMSYEEFVQQNIFDPIGMSNSYILYGDWVQDLVHPYGFNEEVGDLVWAYESEGNDDKSAFYLSADWASGFIHTTVSDLCKFFYTVTVSDGITPSGERLLTRATVEEIRTPKEIVDTEDLEVKIGFGFFFEKIGIDGFGHNGGEEGVSTDAWYDIETETGYIVLGTSGDNTRAIQAMSDTLPVTGLIVLFAIIVVLLALALIAFLVIESNW